MKVTVDSNLRIQNSFEPPIQMELALDKNALQDVLQTLSEMVPCLSLIDQGGMGEDLRHLYLNGRSHFSFSEGLKKKINEGDTILVEAYLEPIDGH